MIVTLVWIQWMSFYDLDIRHLSEDTPSCKNSVLYWYNQLFSSHVTGTLKKKRLRGTSCLPKHFEECDIYFYLMAAECQKSRGFQDLNLACKVRFFFSAFVNRLTKYVIRHTIQVRKYDIIAMPPFPKTMHKASQTHFLGTWLSSTQARWY